MRRLPLAVLALVALAVALPAGATTMVLQDLPTAVASADQIVRVRVVGATPVMALGSIWTDYALESLEWLKAGPQGSAPQITIRQLGGTLDGITMVAEGMAQFTVGDEVLLMTKDYGGGWQSVQNVMQGALPVKTTRLPTARGVIERKSLPGAAQMFSEAGGDDLPGFEGRIRRLLAGGVQ